MRVILFILTLGLSFNSKFYCNIVYLFFPALLMYGRFSFEGNPALMHLTKFSFPNYINVNLGVVTHENGLNWFWAVVEHANVWTTIKYVDLELTLIHPSLYFWRAAPSFWELLKVWIRYWTKLTVSKSWVNKNLLIEVLIFGAWVVKHLSHDFLSRLSGLSKYALFTKYRSTSVNRIPKNPTIRIGLCGRS